MGGGHRGLLLALDALARRHERVDRLFRGLGLPLVLLLAIGVAVDGWARRSAPAITASPSPDSPPD